MITDRYAEERIRSWLIATAPRHLPDRVLTDTYERTRRMAQASSVRTWWSRVTRPLPIVFAAGAIAVVVVLVNIELGSLGGGADRPLGVSFASTAPISGQWVSANSEAFSVQFAEPEDDNLYWRAAVYDTFELTAWKQTVTAGYDVPMGEEVLGASADRVAETGRREVRFRVFPTSYREPTIVSPQSPSAVDTNVRVAYVGDRKFLAAIDRSGGDPYTVTALVPKRIDEEGRSRSTVFVQPGPPTRRRSAGSTSRCPTVPSRRRRRGEAPRRHPCRGRGPGQPVRRCEHDGRLPAVVGQLQVRRRRPRPRLRGPVHRRVLRPLPARLLPVLRVDDGNPAP